MGPRYIFFLILCLACSQVKQTKMISNFKLHDDCNFWVETSVDKSFVRAGISGACGNLSFDEYANSLDSIFISQELNSRTYPNLKFLYLNIYDCNETLMLDLINKINASSVWENNLSSTMDEAFLLFSKESGYMNQIESIVKKHFGEDYILSFQGVNCVSKDELMQKHGGKLKLNKSCYPLSFGLAVFNRR